MVDSSDSITAGPGTASPAGMRARSQTTALDLASLRETTPRRLPLTGSVPAGAGLSRISRGGIAPTAVRRALTSCTGSPRLS